MQNHESLASRKPSHDSKYWKFVISGIKGDKGDAGDVYVPSIDNGKLVFTKKNDSDAVDVSVFDPFKGDKGETPDFRVISTGDDRMLQVKYDSTDWSDLGNVGGPRGYSPILKKSSDGTYIALGYENIPESDWTKLVDLEDLRGESISSIEINSNGGISVTTSLGNVLESYGTIIPEFVVNSVSTVESSNNANVSVSKDADGKWAFDFSIPKGERGEKGDDNIHIGPTPPEDPNKIWYDTSDNDGTEMYLGSPSSILWKAYLDSPGRLVEDPNNPGKFINEYLSEEEFFKAFGSISTNYLTKDNIKTINGLSIIGRGNIEISGSGESVDLSNYYTKDDVNSLILDSIDGEEIDPSN